MISAETLGKANVTLQDPDGFTAGLNFAYTYTSDGSLLYQQVASGLMPRGGPPISMPKKQKIFDWILAGAKDN